ncbi:hypothetical protein ACMU_11295 [Actibacterium mucosum KCTC 23349]|uniref:Uncharacterized protein n=1 Tax=Actibacterium mucosum KCTC 23349 TaxID=1454373 RepID=A0A037ZGL4_9RHOB|nr:DUF6476 family protein [Actibacterium mucosum]KAJ55278.1 hypothetical protein ACMU_11295 [Actibacterium mucosum KCTC 23349]
MDKSPDEMGELPPNLRFLRGLVTVLTAVMIGGLILLLTLIVIRFRASDDFALPDAITLPEGATVQALTKGEGWWAVVTGDNRILIYSARTGALIQEVAVQSE